jgi:hypothetical protein
MTNYVNIILAVTYDYNIYFILIWLIILILKTL